MSASALRRAGTGVAAASASRATFLSLLALLAWAPVPLASNRGWSQGLLAAGLLLLAFAASVARLWQGERAVATSSHGNWPMVLLCAWAAFALAQMVPLPAAVLEMLSPHAHAAWRAAGVPGPASLSLDRAASAAQGVHAASLAAAFWLVLWCVSSGRRLRVACALLVALGALEAVAGIALALARSRGWIASGPVEGVGGISGTFVNPNHFAGFLEMCLCVSIGMTLSTGPRWLGRPVGVRDAIDRGVAFALSARFMLLAAQLLMAVALFWSGSRGALLALGIALPTVIVLLPPRPQAGPAARMRPVAGAALVLALALAWGGPGSLGEKLASAGGSGARLDLAGATLSMAADFPLTGAGAGSFRSVFPAYKTEPLGSAYFEHAHNDYLEFLAEGGIIGVALFVAAVASAIAGALTRARRRRDAAARALTGGCAAAALSLLVHGLYDFNLQIPANATLFVVVLGLATAASALPSEPRREVAS